MVQNEISLSESEFTVNELREALSPEQLQNIWLQRMAIGQGQQAQVLAPASSNTAAPALNVVGQVSATPPRATLSDATTIICSSCGTVNTIPSNDIHYTITVGKSVGVFSDLAFVQSQVMGVSGACFKRYPSQATALQAYQHAALQGVVRIVNA